MNTHRASLGKRTLVIAVQVALLALAGAASAQDSGEEDALRQQVQPTDSIEVGLGWVSDDSFKFGEYNGLQNEGMYGIVDFFLNGGDAYDSDGARRWRVVATNLGLDSREMKIEYGEQGRFRISLDYDELLRNRSDSYETPYQGVGSSILTLPGNWLPPRVPQVNANNINFRSLLPAASQTPAIVGGATVTPTPAQITQMQNIVANDTAAFHQVDLHTKREKTRTGFGFQLSPEWDFKATAENEHKEGLKPMSTVSSQVSEFAAVIPDRIDQDTQQYNVSFNYTGNHAFAQVGYYGSVYDNHVGSMTWQDVNNLSKFATMSSAPNNEFHQFLVTGGYNFSRNTKLVMNGSYGQATQDDTFLLDPSLPLGVPRESLDGKVVFETLGAKLTSHPVAGLNLNVGYKYDNRDNRTDVATYYFQDANEARAAAASPFNAVLGLPPNTLGSNINIYANRPYSKELNQFDASADWAIASGQVLRGAYQYQKIDRQCDGSWINCADAPRTEENLGQIEWRTNLIENLSTSLSYTYSSRNADYDENAFLALVPMANFIPAGGATQSVYQYLLTTGLTGFGPNLGYPTTPLTGDANIFSPNNNIVPQVNYGSRNNINELLGVRRYNMADRNRDRVRARLDWQASEKFTLDGSLDYDNDDYSNSLYGLTGAKSWALNLEGAYAFSEKSSASLFYTYEERDTESSARAYGSNSNTAFIGIAANTAVQGGCFDTVQERNNNAKIDPCLDWTSDAKDKVHTFGLTWNHKGLMDGKLALEGDLIGTQARTNIDVSGGSYVNNPLAASGRPPVTPAIYYIPAANLPEVKNDTVEFRLAGHWALNPQSELGMYYWYSHLHQSDYVYEGMQFGTITAVMPTNEKSQSYNVSVVALTYTYHWQ